MYKNYRTRERAKQRYDIMCIAIKYEIERTKTVLIEICKCTVLALVEKQEKTSQNGRAVNQNMFQQHKTNTKTN